MKPTLAFASDHAGVDLKSHLRAAAETMGYCVEDLGAHDGQSVDYPDYANKMAQWMQQHPQAFGVLICGSGVGISIAANRHRHIRAALCHNGLSAKLARQHNDANVLCLGARLMGLDVAKDCLEQFLTTPFEGGRHQKRVEKLGQHSNPE